MIVRGPEFWGLDLIVSMTVAYAVVLALALAVAAARASLRRRAARPAQPAGSAPVRRSPSGRA